MWALPPHGAGGEADCNLGALSTYAGAPLLSPQRAERDLFRNQGNEGIDPGSLASRRAVLRFAALALAGCFARPLLALNPPSRFEGDDVLGRLLRLAHKEKWRSLPIGDLVGAVGLNLVGTPYVAGTLDTDAEAEACFVSLTGLDCVTFYEACLGFARMLKRLSPHPSVAIARRQLMAEVQTMRYRGGKVDGYLSRLHYASDWFFDNDRRKIVRLITKYLPGAVAMDKPLNFMSTHPASYAQLKAHPDLVLKLAAMEVAWSARKPQYVPNVVVPMVESLLETGDLIGIATSAAGLDTSHTGICYRDETGALRMLHASSAHHKVELGPRLSDFLVSAKNDIGIFVARPSELPATKL